jgi:opacity protein-like surface antigen
MGPLSGPLYVKGEVIMGRSSALILAAAIVAGASVSASAADLLPPPPPMMEPPPPPDFGGWYLRGDVGVGATQVTGWRTTLQPVGIDNFGFQQPAPTVLPVFGTLGDTTFVDAGVGYQFNNWLRADVTGEYRNSASYRAAVGWANQFGQAGGDVYSGNFRTALFLANGYVDLGTWYGISPFVGASVGFANHWLDTFIDHGFGYAQDTSKTNFAWAVTGGLGYAVTPNLRLELSYRYLDMGSFKTNAIQCQFAPCWHEQHSFHVASNDVRLGFRYILPSLAPVMAPPPPPPPPLVRKY